MAKTRKARYKFEVDLLPPFGVPEVNMYGQVALLAGTIVATGYVLKTLQDS